MCVRIQLIIHLFTSSKTHRRVAIIELVLLLTSNTTITQSHCCLLCQTWKDSRCFFFCSTAALCVCFGTAPFLFLGNMWWKFSPKTEASFDFTFESSHFSIGADACHKQPPPRFFNALEFGPPLALQPWPNHTLSSKRHNVLMQTLGELCMPDAANWWAGLFVFMVSR